MASKRLNRSLGGTILVFIILVIFGLFFLLPILYMAFHAFMPLDEIFMFPPHFFVSRPTLDNFTTMFQLTGNLWVPFTRYLFNSVIVSGVGTVVYIFIACMCAYPLAKIKFRGQKIIYNGIVYALLFAPEVLSLPCYIIMSKIGLLNTYFAVLFPLWATPLGVFLMERFMVQFPDDVIEAAEIDGAGLFGTFRDVVMPNMKPAWLTLIIFFFVPAWSTTAATTSSAVLFSENMKLLPTVLQSISAGGTVRAGAASAVALFLFLPPFLLFVFTQSKVMETMAYSGIKA